MRPGWRRRLRRNWRTATTSLRGGWRRRPPRSWRPGTTTLRPWRRRRRLLRLFGRSVRPAQVDQRLWQRVRHVVLVLEWRRRSHDLRHVPQPAKDVAGGPFQPSWVVESPCRRVQRREQLSRGSVGSSALENRRPPHFLRRGRPGELGAADLGRLHPKLAAQAVSDRLTVPGHAAVAGKSDGGEVGHVSLLPLELVDDVSVLLPASLNSLRLSQRLSRLGQRPP